MNSLGVGLHLDPLLPLAVRSNPATVPSPSSGAASGLFVCTGASVSVSTGASRLSASAPALLRFGLSDAARFVRKPESGWLIVIGGRLIDELVVGAFGEPGFSRFIEDIDRHGVTPCGEFDSALESLLDSLSSELKDRKPAYRVRARSMLTGILLLLYRASLVSPELTNGDGLRFGAVLDYIELHYADDLRLADLAELMGTGTTYFSRLFRNEIGMPVFEYINRTRIRKACLLLRREDLPVTRIALDVGYNSVSFFNRYFRRVMNQTPREYRRFLRS